MSMYDVILLLCQSDSPMLEYASIQPNSLLLNLAMLTRDKKRYV